MAVQSTVVVDTPEFTDFREVDASIGYEGFRREWKPGSVAYNAEQLRAKAAQALTANAAFLALASPTNAQVVTQVQRLTRECNALLRDFIGALNDVSDT